MSSIAHKKQMSLTLPRALRGAVADGKQIEGQSWPCHVVAVEGAIVTIAFDVSGDFTLPQVTCPIAESRYVRLPVQVGDTGYAAAAGARLGGVTDLGTGVAPLALPSNLGALVFFPLGRKSWETIDANAVVIQAPNGSKILTDDGASEIIVDTNQVRITQGDVTVTITGGVVTVTADHVVVNAGDSTFNGDVIVNGDLTVSGDVAVGGSAVVAAGVTAATLTVAGLAAVGSLTIGGHPYASHIHLPGTYHIGSSNVAGNSGGVV